VLIHCLLACAECTTVYDAAMSAACIEKHEKFALQRLRFLSPSAEESIFSFLNAQLPWSLNATPHPYKCLLSRGYQIFKNLKLVNAFMRGCIWLSDSSRNSKVRNLTVFSFF
jgi:hypothetical protein